MRPPPPRPPLFPYTTLFRSTPSVRSWFEVRPVPPWRRPTGARMIGGREGGRGCPAVGRSRGGRRVVDRKSTRLNSSHVKNSYAGFCLKKNNGPAQQLAERKK